MSATPRPRRSRLLRWLGATTTVLVLAAGGQVVLGPAASASVAGSGAAPVDRAAASKPSRTRDPRLTRELYVDPTSQAAIAAQGDPRLALLASTASSLWLTGAAGVDAVGAQARDYAARADAAGRTPVVTLYALPGRDCGSFSAGGLDATSYRAWVGQVATALTGRHAIAVLEPDAVPLMGSCAGQESWPALLKHAAKRLTAAGVWVYVDAGHSSWIPPAETARRLARSGLRWARGFSTNVSNFNATGKEKAYGRQVVEALAARGRPGKHYLVDIGRNGAGAAPYASWCNPPSARLGHRPEMVGRGALDGLLWIKPPGESDGACGGGPSAGTFWRDGALRLLGLL